MAARALAERLRTESGAALLLVGVTLLALVWANSPLSGAYEALWSLPIHVDVGDLRFDMDLHHEAVVDPVVQVHVEAQVADVDVDRQRPQGLVAAGQRRVGPHERQQRDDDEQQRGTGLGAQPFGQRAYRHACLPSVVVRAREERTSIPARRPSGATPAGGPGVPGNVRGAPRVVPHGR